MSARIDKIGPFEYQRFAPVLPQTRNGREEGVVPVVIVGGGPVGLSVALGLANYGVRSVIVEADDSVCEGSRAACVSRRSLEIMERIGAVDGFLAKGLPWTDGRSFYREDEVLHFSMPSDPAGKYPPMVNLQQYYIEQELLEAVSRCNAKTPGMIEVRWASRVGEIDRTSPSHVALQVVNALGTYRMDAQWVVAADGGQSTMREALGLQLTGTGYQGRYVIIDIELASDYPTERRAWFDPPWWRGSTVLMHRQPDNIWRIDYQLRPGDSPEDALSDARVQEFVQTHLDAIGEGHLPWRPVWTSVYRAGAMTLDNYRHGRILFAGNAAHAMPIFGVRGLNSGFDDADNLAWKLALVAKHGASDALLDSYSDERIAAFHINAAAAMRSTEFMSPPSRGFDLMREAALSLAVAHPDIALLINPRQTQAVSYLASSLSAESDAFESGPAPGELRIDVMLPAASVRHLSDAVQVNGFMALVFGKATQELADVLRQSVWPAHLLVVSRAGSDAGGALTLNDADGRLHRTYGACEGDVYLLRPDGHIAGRWHQPSADVLARAIAVACASSTSEYSMEIPA